MRYPSSPGDMETNSKRQRVVKFLVGHVPFTLSYETIFSQEKKSLLAELTEEYSELVEKGEYLFIDRNPKAFPWIIEIHRNGDFRSCIPDMCLEELEKELRFYKLKSLSRLGIGKQRIEYPVESGVTPMAALFHDILAEIRTCGYLYLLPVHVFVYYEFAERQIVGETHRVLVVPLSAPNEKYVAERGHSKFLNALYDGGKTKREPFLCGRKSRGKKLKTEDDDEYWVIDFLENESLALLNMEAAKWNMKCSNSHQQYGPGGDEIAMDPLLIQYSTA